MQFRRSPSTRVIDRDWHERRQRARESAYDSDLGFFGDAERIKYDLDTAQIDGSDNPRTFMLNVTIDLFGVNGTDVRQFKDR